MRINNGQVTYAFSKDSTVIYYFMYKKKSKNYVKHLILPLMGIFIIGFVWINVNPLAMKLGAGWIVIGLIIYFFVTKVLKRDATLEV